MAAGIPGAKPGAMNPTASACRLTRSPATTGLAARALAEVLSPALLWPESQASDAAGNPLPPEARVIPEAELECITTVLAFLISNFRNPDGYLSS